MSAVSELPQVGQTYKHKTHGDVEVLDVIKRGRGYRVHWADPSGELADSAGFERLKDWQKATT